MIKIITTSPEESPSKKKDTPGVSVSKKKAPSTTDKSKGIDLLSEAALLEDTQMEKVLKQSKRKTHSLQPSGSGDGVGSQPKVSDEPKESGDDDDINDDDSDDVSDDDGNDDNSDDDGNNDASDNERIKSDEDENPNLNHNYDDIEEEYVYTLENYESTDDENKHVNEEEYDRIDKDLYKDVNVKLKDIEHGEKGKGDAEMTDAGHDNVTQETTYDQFEDDAHVTLTSAHVTQKTEGPLQSSSVLSDFTTQFLNLDNVLPADNEIISMMNVKVRHEEPSNQTPSLLTISVMVLKEEVKSEREKYMEFIEKSVKANVIDQVKIQLPHILPKEVSDFATPVIQSTVTESLENVVLAKSSSQPQSIYEATTSLTEFELKKILLDKMQKNRKDKDKDEDPSVGSNQGLKRQKTSKDVEPSKGPKSKESKSRSSKGTKSQPKSSGKSAQAEESVFEVSDTEMPQNQRSDLGNTSEQPNVKDAQKHDWLKKPKRPLTPDLDWNVGKSVDFRPPQTWISKIAQAEKPPLSFNELMSTPIDFSAYVMNHL
ncbi:hypothetical protein Tco_0816978, partial [Tanacetum coccineum]